MAKICNECGYPLNGNEDKCPECGNPLKTTPKSYNPDMDYNETKGYSPFKANAWIFSTPSILKKFPRGHFALKHPFWGWLFGPWHISPYNLEDTEYINVVNNIFYLLNQIFKFVLYALIWVLFKTWFILLIGLAGGVLFTTFGAINYNNALTTIGIIVLGLTYIFSGIMLISGTLASLSRYSSPIIRSFRRICKRHWISMYKAVKNNNLDLN